MHSVDDSKPFYLRAFRGSFTTALRWHKLDALWDRVRDGSGDGYLYAVGEEPPGEPADAARVETFVTEIDRLLRREHQEDYCGIVYADDLQAPGLIKIYDPHNLGVSCGYSDNPPLPGWVMSRIPPVDLSAAQACQGSPALVATALLLTTGLVRQFLSICENLPGPRNGPYTRSSGKCLLIRCVPQTAGPCLGITPLLIRVRI